MIMNKIYVTCLAVLVLVSIYGYNHYASEKKQGRWEAGLALFYLTENEGWLSGLEQLDAINKKQLIATSAYTGSVGIYFYATGVVKFRPNNLCKLVEYRWQKGNTGLVELIQDNDC